MTKAIVLGGSRGIGKSISNALKIIEIDVFAASKSDIDTSNLDSIRKFLEKNTQTDILVLKKPEIFVKIIVNYLKIKMKITSQLFPKHQKFKIFLKIN